MYQANDSRAGICGPGCGNRVNGREGGHLEQTVKHDPEGGKELGDHVLRTYPGGLSMTKLQDLTA